MALTTTELAEFARLSKELMNDGGAHWIKGEFLMYDDHDMRTFCSIGAVRQTILAADRSITEGIKWNSPSFYKHGWFATVNVRPKHGVLVVLHHGAKARSNADLGASLNDPDELLDWLGKDRATVAFTDDVDFKKKRSAFTKIIKQWAKYQTTLAELG